MNEAALSDWLKVDLGEPNNWKNQSWFLNLDQTYETLWIRAENELLILMSEKLVSLTGAIVVKMDSFVLEEKPSFIVVLSFSSKLDWGSYTEK